MKTYADGLVSRLHLPKLLLLLLRHRWGLEFDIVIVKRRRIEGRISIVAGWLGWLSEIKIVAIVFSDHLV